MNANILLKDYCPAIAERGGIASADIIDLNLDAIDIKDGAITKDKIADGAVTEEKLAEGLVYDVSDDSIETDMIQDGAVTEDKIADGAVTANKFADALKSVAIANLDSEAALSDVITAVNSILAALRTFGIIAPSE